jgi:ABC-type branched-subunit amino acid transport system permease subunit
MSTQTQNLRGPSSIVGTVRARLDKTQIGGRPPSYYLSGWRLGVLFLVLAILFPLVITDQSLQVTAILVGIYVLLALGLNIVVGYAGLLDLGYVAFFVVGSYTVAVFTGGILQRSDGTVATIPMIPFWFLLPLAALLAGLFGVLLGAPTLRLRGDYLAIVTLGFGQILPIVFQNVPWFFGQLGMSALPPPDIGPISFSDPLNHAAFYYLILLLVVLVILAVSSLRDSSLGRAWVAIREDETAAAASGVNLVRTKLLAFGLGAVTGGIGGALNAAFLTAIAPTDFNFGISITILVMIVLGGLGSIPGVIIGAMLLRFFDVYLLGKINDTVHGSPLVTADGSPLHFLATIDFNTAKYLFYGLILMAMILLRPQGLIPNVRRQRELAGIGAAPEGVSAVGLFEQEVAGEELVAIDVGEQTEYVGEGSEAMGREDHV